MADGSYLPIGKSTHHRFQGLCYSGQKIYNLLKPFIVYDPDGNIVDIFGLNCATFNDSKIMVDVLENYSDFTSLLNEGDFVILDRGFCDFFQTLEKTFKTFQNNNFKTLLPCFLNKNMNQFTTQQANLSRIFTKIHWFIEAVIRILKNKYQTLDGKLENKSLPHILEDFGISGIDSFQ